MGMSDLWRGQMLYYQLFQIGFLGGVVVFFFVEMEWYSIGLIFVCYILAFNFLMLRRRSHAKEKQEGNRFLETRLIREKNYSEEMVIPFLNYQELAIQNMPVDIEKLPEYNDARLIELAIDDAKEEAEEEISAWEQDEISEDEVEIAAKKTPEKKLYKRLRALIADSKKDDEPAEKDSDDPEDPDDAGTDPIPDSPTSAVAPETEKTPGDAHEKMV